ncbi:amylo-alpha-1,6-glucosidase [Rhodoplanes roseus]|uniref:Amylo-alpha-1,6-glucosidase n=1 Tax=Rhodoplanes roseus TaxID=29409 RepID=A0A327L111_9BRAD|nr:amylo-alpha-1,6-glucosidase [Rhodoplanes roseus]RAI43635.1 amylo-alpha-1,6-glucosidase [Rhodoplanes roseus]
MEIASPTTVSPADTVQDDAFYIPATGPTRLSRILKCGDSFAVLDSHGDIGATAGAPDGLFHADTRYLSRFELRIAGASPLLLGSNVRDDNTVLTVDLTNPDIYAGKTIALEKDTLHVVRTVFIWDGRAYHRFGLTNHADRPIGLEVSLLFANDFADLFEVRGFERKRRGTSRSDVVGDATVMLTYDGLDERQRRTTIAFDPAPTRLDKSRASFQLAFEAGQSRSIFAVVRCADPEDERPPVFYRALSQARRGLQRAASRATTIETSNQIFNEMICRAVSDLYMLVTDTPQGPYPYAGIPWYSTTFGRDGLITALQTLWLDPAIARGVLRRLAAFQAKTRDAESDAEPGKILHEMRGGELAALGEIPFGLYYGSVDSTPLFVLLAGLYAERTGDDETLKELWPAIDAGLQWIDGPGDPDRDGFTEYHRATERGLANQGWKDSHDAIFHADGHLADGPIALAEVQGYVYAAKLLIARGAARLGHIHLASRLQKEATELAERFEAAFWCPEIGTYALALDGKKTPLRVRTSNAGQVLFTGIARRDRALAVIDGLLRPPFFSGWGIRTVSTGERRYNPMSYHNGSIWPHDNSLIALGFARYGRKSAVEPVFTGLFDAASYMDLRRLPELFCGFQRRRGRGPTLYPVACAPQAWASAAPFLLLHASLGLEFDPEHRQIRLRDPQLPAFLDWVTLRNLRLGDASVDLKIRRHNTTVSVEILGTQGTLHVVVVYSGGPGSAETAGTSRPGPWG